MYSAFQTPVTIKVRQLLHAGKNLTDESYKKEEGIMFNPIAAFSGFSVNDLATAKEFYTNVLGLTAKEEMGGMTLTLPNGTSAWVYPKEDHQAATYTVLNFVVTSVDTAVDELTGRGVQFERYEGVPQDDKGIARGIAADMGPDIAWFKDPAGNILAVLQQA
jgi:catechol 2,3-dioxygenase-like lactoylglutathione lyase family enzyme